MPRACIAAQSVNCGPRGLPGEPDHLFHNNGDGTFTDVTVKAGVEDKDKYYGFSTIFVDINGDGKPDLVVGNDSEPNFLYINKGDGTFEDESYVSGFALNKDGREIASMGIAAGDYENNGLIDFLCHRLRRRLQGALPQRRRRQLYRRELQGGHRADYDSLCGLGRRLPRLRQRWLARSV